MRAFDGGDGPSLGAGRAPPGLASHDFVMPADTAGAHPLPAPPSPRSRQAGLGATIERVLDCVAEGRNPSPTSPSFIDLGKAQSPVCCHEMTAV